jgi:general secretion pathway protein D
MLVSRIPIHRTKLLVLTFAALAAACLSQAVAAMDPNSPSAPPTSQVFRFTKVTPAEAAAWLRKLNLGETVSELKEANSLVVTCAYGELPKVRTMLKFLDSMPDVTVKVLTSLPAHANWPSNKKLQDRLKNLAIGTFADPPAMGPGAIVIDEHGGFLVAVGSRADLQQALDVLAKYQSGKISAATETANAEKDTKVSNVEPNTTPAESAEDKMLEKMMDTLSKQEKSSAATPPAPRPEAPQATAKASTAPAAMVNMTPEQFAEMVRKAVKEETERQMSQGTVATPLVEDVKTAAEPNLNQTTAAQFDIPAGDLELELQLPERLEVIDLLDLLGKYLKINYMFDETVLKGQAVSLRVQGKIKVKELYAIAENVLRFKGLTMTRSDDLVTISQINTSAPSNGAFVTGVEGVRPGDVVVTRIFQLRYASTAAVRTLLTTLKFANNGQNISEIAETGTLVITDYSLAMPKIEELLSVVDKPGDDRTFKFVKLKYTMAKNLAPKLKDLAEQLGTVSISVSASAASAFTPNTPGMPNVPRPVVARPVTAGGQGTRPGVYLDYDERTNRLLIVGRKEEIGTVEKLIGDLDVAQQDLRTLKQYTIQHVDTSEVLATLKEQGIIQETPASSSTRTSSTAYSRTNRPGMPTTPVPGPEIQPAVTTLVNTGMGPVVEPPMISVIESTNSLLINATAEQHAAIGQIIAYVDQERGETNINYVVYPLENQDPEKLKGILESLITGKSSGTPTDREKKISRSTTTRTGYQPTGMNSPTTSTPTNTTAPSAPTAEAQEQEITIVADTSTYSLIVYASKKNQQWISSVIKDLDTYRPQVLLDCTLVAVIRDNAFKTDLQVITRFGSNTNSAANNIQGPIGKGSLTDPFPSAGWIGEGSVISGTGNVFYSDQHIQALFSAMEQKKYGRVMSRPQLLVNDNEEGTIKSEDKKYVAQLKTTYIATSGSNSVINQPVQDVTYQDYPAGVTLTIKPHISKGDNLKLDIELDRTDYVPGTGGTDIVGGVAYTKPQDTTSNNVISVVTVPDNATIILGGLESLTQTKGGTKVPVLGDLPLVGGLFRSTDNSDKQTKLYIFVKAHILRPGEDAGKTAVEKVSQPKIDNFEKTERDMQRYQDWPGLDAQPMEPRKVLDER